MLNRRQLMQRSPLIAMAPTIPAFLGRSLRAAEPNNDGRILVVIQLSGGNDGINTVVPYSDDGYAKHRSHLRLKTTDLIRLSDQAGLHPSMRPAADLLEDGRLAIVQGVGYPNPNRSHDVSMAIWQTARLAAAEHTTFGWLGRAMDGYPGPTDGSPHSVLLGSENPPIALRGRRTTSISLAHLEDLKLRTDAELMHTATDGSAEDLLSFTRRTALDALSAAELINEVTSSSAKETTRYPRTQLADRLKSIAQLIKSDFATPVYYAIQPGYDTHAAQLVSHSRLLRDLAGATQAFLDDLQAAGLDDRVVVLGFSEFGRRVNENASLGTDHGTAGPVLIAGSPVQSGLVGETPSMTDLEDGDLKMGIDFRQVYATLLEAWLGLDPRTLGESFAPLPLIA